jgi:predicted metal-dependent enzyme (double-stranded beta helix superfamily)
MFDLTGFIAACHGASGARHGPAQVLQLMREAVRDPEAIKAALPAQPPGTSFLDAPLHRSETLTVLGVALAPGTLTVPHDHGMWAVIGIYEGREDNTFYRRAGGELEESNRRQLVAGEAMLLGAEVIHAIRNPLASQTLGLHVYGGDLFGRARSMWSPEGAEAVYDMPGFIAWNKQLARARRAQASDDGG